jgi:hypothetical protein
MSTENSPTVDLSQMRIAVALSRLFHALESIDDAETRALVIAAMNRLGQLAF